MKLKGPFAGNTNQTFDASFRFVQCRKKAGIKEPSKKKVKKSVESAKLEGKPKSKKRVENEAFWRAIGGVERERMDRFWCAGAARPHIDKYGQVRVRWWGILLYFGGVFFPHSLSLSSVGFGCDLWVMPWGDAMYN